LQVRVPNTNMRLVSTTDGIIKEFGVDASQKVAGRFLHGRYTASAGVINSVGDCHLDPDCAVQARVSRGSCSFALPRGGAGYGKTFGLMGALSGDKTIEGQFRRCDGSPSTLTRFQKDNTLFDFGVNGRGHSSSRTNGPRVTEWSRSCMVGTAANPAIDLGLASAAAQKFWQSQAFKVNLLELEQLNEAEVAAERRRGGGAVRRVGRAVQRVIRKQPKRTWAFPMAKSFPVQKVVVTPKKVAFCNKLLKGIKESKRAKHMNSCIMDGEFPELSKAIVKTIKVKAKQRKAAKKNLLKGVRKQQRLAAVCGLKVKVPKLQVKPIAKPAAPNTPVKKRNLDNILAALRRAETRAVQGVAAATKRVATCTSRVQKAKQAEGQVENKFEAATEKLTEISANGSAAAEKAQEKVQEQLGKALDKAEARTKKAGRKLRKAKKGLKSAARKLKSIRRALAHYLRREKNWGKKSVKGGNKKTGKGKKRVVHKMHHGWDIDLRWKQAIPHAQKKTRKLRSWVRAHDKMSKRGYSYRRLTPIVGRRYPDHHVCMRALRAGKKLPALCNTVLKRRVRQLRARKAKLNPRAAVVAAKTALETAQKNGASETVLRRLVANLNKATAAFKKSQRPRRNRRNGRNRRARKVRRNHKKAAPKANDEIARLEKVLAQAKLLETEADVQEQQQ